MTSSLLPVLMIVAGIAMIIVSSFLLTLAIEEIGRRGKFSDRLTGAVISPIFTSLPELTVILIALVIVGRTSGSEIAAGTIIGEPFMVSAIGFPIVALTLLLARKKGKLEEIDGTLSKMLIFMGFVFPIILIPHYVNSVSVRVFVAFLLVILYLVFLKLVRGGKDFEEEATNFKIKGSAAFVLILVVGMALLLSGSSLLVAGIDNLSRQIGVNQELITILLVPLGTIVPETMNAVIWAHRGRTSLAIGAMVGEEIFFVTLYPVIGILASQWVITTDGILAVGLTSSFSVVLGLLTYRSKNAVYVFLFYLVSLAIFMYFIY
ncbi:MAG: sodium:calcium antiporter [Thermoplasmata archaeon]